VPKTTDSFVFGDVAIVQATLLATSIEDPAVSMSRFRAARSSLQNSTIIKRLPALEDSAEVGVEQAQTVPRDLRTDFKFRGTLMACTASNIASRGRWTEYRVYQTAACNYVFSAIGRSALADEHDIFEGRVFFEPTLDSATWANAAINFFGYSPLATLLYRGLGSAFTDLLPK
jgi:hypothetical protein